MKTILSALFASSLFMTPVFANNGHIEFCTGTKYMSKYFGDGNPMGHANIYVKGLCKDMDKNYPQVKICDGKDKLLDGTVSDGVGVSLDSSFKNVSWIAVPDRELFLFGDNGTGVVDNQVMESIISQAHQYRVYQNVEPDRTQYPQGLLDYTDSINVLDGDLGELREQDIVFAIGTDIAFNTARKMYCLKVNVNEKQLTKVRDFLNEENNKYFLKSNKYNWSASDNCTHLSVNSLAAAKVVKYKKTKEKRTLVGNILNLTIPKSELLRSTKKANRSNYNPAKVWRNKKLRSFFNEFKSLPYGPGNLVSKYNFIKENDFFKEEGAETFLAFPIFGMSLKKVQKGKFAQIEANTKLHKRKIQKALNKAFFKRTFKDANKEAFKVEYKNYLENLLKNL